MWHPTNLILTINENKATETNQNHLQLSYNLAIHGPIKSESLNGRLMNTAGKDQSYPWEEPIMTCVTLVTIQFSMLATEPSKIKDTGLAN